VTDQFFFQVLRAIPGGEVIYYSLCNSEFRREMKAVFRGRCQYAKEVAAPSDGNSFLRRNIHRIEKGLSMKERRELFGLSFIDETVEGFLALRASRAGKGCGEMAEYEYFRDVLHEYFEVTARDPRSERSREKFATALGGEECGSSIPYLRKLEAPPSCSYDELLDLAIRRRSVRFFKQKEVPRELVEKAMTVGLYSASACNRQPFSIRMFDDPERVKELAGIPMGTGGYDHQIPCLAVVIGHLDAYFSERDRHLIYIDSSLAMTPFMLACETLGLSTCAINWPDMKQREKRMAEALELNQWEKPIMLMAIGYPDEEVVVPRSTKKPVKEMMIWEK